MTVLVVERVSPSLRGELSKWMIQLKAGVFVGRLPTTVRDRIWRLACSRTEGGSAVLLETADTEQGYRFRMWGVPSRVPEDFEGLILTRELQFELGGEVSDPYARG